MINGETMVVLIVLIGMIGAVLKTRARANQDWRGTPLNAAAPDPEAQRLRDEVRLLKDRIQVLERVITDNHSSHDLDREIDRLRDR